MKSYPPLGTLLVLTGPFASGKKTIALALEENETFERCISITTRQPFDGEIDGYHYHFMTKTGFLFKRDGENAFSGTTCYNGEFYGIRRSTIENGILAGKRMVVCLDMRGVQSLLDHSNPLIRESLVTIYLEVSLSEAIKRFLSKNANFPKGELSKRMSMRLFEEHMKSICDRRIKNPDGNLSKTVRQIELIVARRRKECECFV